MAFHLREGVIVEVPMMRQKTDLNYGEDEAVQVLEMP
jgi:serine protease inhibitor